MAATLPNLRLLDNLHSVAELDLASELFDRSHYLILGLHKAIATTSGRAFCSPYTSFGISSEQGTKKQAIDAALQGSLLDANKCKYAGTCEIIEVK